MKKVIIFVDWFLPGYKAGGQIQSCTNLAYALQDDIEVYIVTSDRDLGDAQAYPDITVNRWLDAGKKIRIMYLSPDQSNYKNYRWLIRDIKPYCIYLNSMFSVPFTLLPLLAARGSRCKKVLAPRGMLHKGALIFSTWKKKLFLSFVWLFSSVKNVVFHATDEKEVSDIKRKFPHNKIVFINDFPDTNQQPLRLIEKQQGYLKCLFVSRLQKKKNLDYLLTLLLQCKAVIELTVIGPKEEESYWEECERIIQKMPPNIRVNYLGAVPNAELDVYYKQSHLFILPTLGENFGHVIFESLVRGRPVLISDQTAWQNLELHKAGWSLPLEDKQSFLSCIEEAGRWQQTEFDDICTRTWQYICGYLQKSDLKQQYLALFTL